MESLKRKVYSLGFALFAALLSYGSAGMIFSSTLHSRELELQEKRGLLAESKALLLRKKDFESEWESRKSLLSPASRPEEALNFWVKELLGFGSSQNLIFTKLEPQGTKEIEEGKEMRLSLTFNGDIRKLTHLLYYLFEKDPFSRIVALSIKEEEESKSFLYELTLGKAL